MRSRNIKPGYFKNECLADCDPLARILFAGLWCLADREGRFEWRPKRIKVEILPYDKCEIDKLLGQLVKCGFIHYYSVNGSEYGFIPTFNHHQSPHPKDAPSKIPKPQDKLDSQELHGNSSNSPMNLESLNLESGKVKVESGKKKNIKKKKVLDCVYLTEEEERKLVEKFGDSKTMEWIEKLNHYVMAKGISYKSHYHAILMWSQKEPKEATKSWLEHRKELESGTKRVS